MVLFSPVAQLGLVPTGTPAVEQLVPELLGSGSSPTTVLVRQLQLDNANDGWSSVGEWKATVDWEQLPYIRQEALRETTSERLGETPRSRQYRRAAQIVLEVQMPRGRAASVAAVRRAQRHAAGGGTRSGSPSSIVARCAVRCVHLVSTRGSDATTVAPSMAQASLVRTSTEKAPASSYECSAPMSSTRPEAVRSLEPSCSSS